MTAPLVVRGAEATTVFSLLGGDVTFQRVARRVFALHGARSGPMLTYDYPGAICLSVDHEIVHGVPGDRPLRPA